METRYNSLIFDLPLIAHLDPSQNNWFLNPSSWVTDKLFKKIFQNARDGQGFSGIIYIEKNPSTLQYFARITIDPAFNGKDGLAREDKFGKPYFITQYVDSNQSSPGMVHKTSIKKKVIKNLFSNSKSLLSKKLEVTLNKNNPDFSNKGEEEQKKLRKESIIYYFPKLFDSGMVQENAAKLKGLTFGISIIKGAESKETVDYEIIYIKDTNKINYTTQLFRENKDIPLLEYMENKKYLLLLETTTSDIFDVYYIQNQKFVRHPHYNNTEIIPPQVKLAMTDDKNTVVKKCLKALNIYYPLIINNKSASQNNLSIYYDFDFESYTMYLDRKKYLAGNTLMPEGNEWGSLYDLKRSIPIGFMYSVTKSIYSSLDLKISDKAPIYNKKWNSWENTPFENFEKVLNDFLHATPQQKWEVFENNIHITARLYENTLKCFIKYHCTLDNIDEHPSFKTHHKNYGGYVNYLLELEKRIEHLSMSYYHLLQELKENPNELLHSARYIPSWFEDDTRTIENVFADCLKLEKTSDKSQFEIIGFSNSVQNIIIKIQNLDKLHNDYLIEIDECIKKMCMASNENEIMEQFLANQKNFLFYIRHAYVDRSNIDTAIKNGLQKKNFTTKKSPLDNIIEHGWENAIALFKGYDVIDLSTCIKKRKYM